MSTRPDTEKRDVKPSDRRSDAILRTLIDEMLQKVRDLNRSNENLTSAEHAKAVAELDGVMARIRRTAARRRLP